ncbi:MAG: acyltransferase family protein [Bariatricus sp.]
MKERNASIDLLKTISMFMVVILHATHYGIANANIIPLSVPYFITNISRSFSIVAVNVFILISGYFLCRQTVTFKKIFKLWLQVELYSVGIYLVLCIIPSTNITFNVKDLVKYALPLLTNQYWFFTQYIILIILSPIINHFINSLTQEQYKKVLMILLLLFSVVPTISIFGNTFGVNNGFSFSWFIVLYLISAYIRNYPINLAHPGLIYIACSIILLLAKILSDFIPLLAVFSNLLFIYNSVAVTISSVMLFIFFSNHSNTNTVISKISSLTFAVYLFHEHGALRSILWDNIICLDSVSHDPLMFTIRFAISILAIFIFGLAIDYIRSNVVILLGNFKK